MHPEYPPEGIPRSQLAQRYGGDAWLARLGAMFDAAGLPHTDAIERVPNTMRALRLTELAREQGRHHELHDRLFAAYWAHGRDIGDEDVLLAEAAAAGIEEEAARAVLESERFADVVATETQRAIEAGAGGVPAWIVDGRVLVPGAQPHEVFERVLERLGYEPVDEGAPAGEA